MQNVRFIEVVITFWYSLRVFIKLFLIPEVCVKPIKTIYIQCRSTILACIQKELIRT